jgi:hypothetical protein
MVVQTQNRHPGHSRVVGLHIGRINVQQYFPRDVADIELELDHLRIVCPLEPSFWQDRPEIHDFRLSSWLESKRNSGKLAANAAPVAMIPCGHRAYRLQLMRADEVDGLDALNQPLAGIAGAHVAVTGIMGATYLSPAERTGTSASMHRQAEQERRDQHRQDRRSRNAARTPDRRRVARLNNDDSPPPSDSN